MRNGYPRGTWQPGPNYYYQPYYQPYYEPTTDPQWQPQWQILYSCPYCGKGIKAGSFYCPYCGAVLITEKPEETEKDKLDTILQKLDEILEAIKDK